MILCHHVRACLTLMLILLGFPVVSRAAEIEMEAATLLSHYMWRGLRLSEGLVYQASVTASTRGFSLNLWGNYDFKAKKLSEADVSIAYNREFQKFDFEAGLMHYGIVEGEDSDELFANIAAKCPLRPAVSLSVDVNAGKGAFLQASAGHTAALTPRAKLDVTANLGFAVKDGFTGIPDDGRERTGFHHAELVISCPIKISSRWDLELKTGIMTPLGRNAREAIRNASVWDPSEGAFNGTTVYGGITLFLTF